MILIKKIFSYFKKFFYYLFAKQHRFRSNVFLKMKIRHIIKNHADLRNKKNRDKKYLNDSKKFLKKIVPGCTNTNWHYVLSEMNGMKKVEYIPENLFFLYIEPALNKVELSKAIADKMSYDNYFSLNYLPKTFYKILNNDYFNAENVRVNKTDVIRHLNTIDDQLVLKPAISTGGGKGVVIANAGEIARLLQSDKPYLKGDYVIQEKIKQHPEIARLNSSSLNTCRIMTARVGAEIVMLGAILRMGRNNKQTDNGKGGGIACNVEKSGKISDFASNLACTQHFDRHPDTGFVFKGFSVPGFEKALEFCKTHHRKFIHFTFISWDVGIREDGRPVFIEFNLKTQDVNWHQYFNGPLFGEYVDYFIEQYHQSKHCKSFTQ